MSIPSITNCTITGNHADNNGGGIYILGGSYPTITNCILWNDSPDEVYVDGGDVDIKYSDIQGGWPGEGNINERPRFIPFPVFGFEYLLKPGSPCIDAGAGEDDLYDWHPRWPNWYPNGARADMGAYGGSGNRGWLR